MTFNVQNLSRDSRSFIQRMEGLKKLEFQMDFERTFFLTRIFKGRESSCVFVQVAIVLGLLVAQCAGMASGNLTVGSWRIGGTPDNIVLLVWNYRVTCFFVCNLVSLPSNFGKLLMNSM